MAVNACAQDGSTALYVAANQDKARCLELLLQAPGVDVNMAHMDGSSALRSAASQGNVQCLELLLASPNIDVNVKDRFGITALQVRHSYDSHIRMIHNFT